MKNVLLPFFCLLMASPLFSQHLMLFNKWKVQSFSVSFGTDMDMIKGLDYTYMLKTAKGVNESKFSNLGFEPENVYSMACENPNIRVSATLAVPGLKNTELDVSFYGIIDRYDYVSYYTRDYEYDYLNEDYQYLSFNSTQNELGLESTIKKRLKLRFLHLYGGLGTNLGFAFDGEMMINGDIQQTANQNSNRNFSDIVSGNYYEDYHYRSFETRDGFQQRIYGQLGVGFVLFKRLELGIDYRRGIGYKAIFGAPLVGVNLHSMGMAIKWHLK